MIDIASRGRPPGRRILALVACSLAVAAPQAVAGEPPPSDAELPDGDCSLKVKRTYPLDRLLRNKGVTIPTRCDGPARVMVSFDISAPIEVTMNTPHQGVQDASSGRVAFERAGKKDVRLKLLKQAARAIGDHRWIKVGFRIAIEMPDYPGWYYSDPKDRRRAVFRR
jgi:hypothetical protein